MEIKIDFTAPLVLLTLLFVVLKLAEVISWSWLWVFSPVLIPLMMVLAFYVLVFVLGIIIGLAKLVS